MLGRIFLSAAAVAIAAPALSQSPAPTRELPYDRGYDIQTERHEVVDAVEKPVTEALNIDARAASASHNAITAHVQARQQEYAVAEAQYEASLKQHASDEVAYTRAMDAWRMQVADCNAGVTSACNAPSPNPEDYR